MIDKRQYSFKWRDIDDIYCFMPRKRLAQLLSAARSHRDSRLKKLAPHHYMIYEMEVVA